VTQTYPGFPPTPPPTPPTPQYPVQQGYPAAPGQLPYAPQYPQYGQPPAPGYPPMQMAPPATPLAQGSIDDFYNQPSTGGGKALTFESVGTRYIGIVTRPLGSGDIQQQTDTRGVPQFFKDGRPKFVMKVPLQMQPSPLHPDGLGTWFVKGAARDELVRAMAEVGAPAGPPEAGAIIDVTHTALRPSGAGMNPAKLFHIVYTRADGQTSSPAPTAVAQPVYAPPAPQQPAFAQPAQAPAAQPPAEPVAAPQAPAGLTSEQQALLAKLTGSS
jgi:hypothetical protein